MARLRQRRYIRVARKISLPFQLAVLTFMWISSPLVSQPGTSGQAPPVSVSQRDVVTASNTEAWLLTRDWPRIDVEVTSEQLTCYEDHIEPHSVSQNVVSIRWCWNETNGITSGSAAIAEFDEELTNTDVFCGWEFHMGERSPDRLFCQMVGQDISGQTVRVFIALASNGEWHLVDEIPNDPKSFEALPPYPLSGNRS